MTAARREPAEGERVIVLDRDGTLVIDRGYLDDPAGLEWTAGAPEALRWWRDHGYRLVVITNQSGIGRGLIALERVREINARLEAMASAIGARIEGTYFCPHRPEEGCRCRKPELGLLTEAAAELGFEPCRCVVIGDKASDVELGLRARAHTIRLARGQVAAGDPPADLVVSNLLEAAQAVTARGW